MPGRVTVRQALAWLVVAPLAAFAVVRLLGVERGYPLVPLLAFTPFVAVAALAVAAGALALRVRTAAAAAGLIAIVLGGLVVPRALGGDTQRRGPALRVMTSNVYLAHGDAAALVQLATREDVDVLAVQELDRAWTRRADAAGLRARFPYRVTRYGGHTRSTALFSRVPIRRLPVPGGTDNPIARGTVQVGGRAVEVASVHPPPPIRRRVGQRDREIAAMPSAGGGVPRVLAGDFNATLDHAPLRALLDRGYRDAADAVGAGLDMTWPATSRRVPPVAIDHVLADRRLAVRDFGVFALRGTDHRPVAATLVSW